MGLCANAYYCDEGEYREKHKMIKKNCLYDDMYAQLKEYKYFKIKEASKEEIERSIYNENFLRRADGTKVCTIPRHLLLYDLGKEYEGKDN